MKPLLLIFIVFLTIFVVSCTPLETSQPEPTTAPVTMPVNTPPAVEATAQVSGVEVSSATVMPLSTISATAESGAGSSSGILPTGGVTLSDNGKTFVMHVGESFLLNLGMDIYDWTVEVDNQNVLHREMNVMVIRGAQGIYIAQTPGTAILTASGNPLCQQSKPPCMMPSLLFRVTVIVQ